MELNERKEIELVDNLTSSDNISTLVERVKRIDNSRHVGCMPDDFVLYDFVKAKLKEYIRHEKSYGTRIVYKIITTERGSTVGYKFQTAHKRCLNKRLKKLRLSAKFYGGGERDYMQFQINMNSLLKRPWHQRIRAILTGQKIWV